MSDETCPLPVRLYAPGLDTEADPLPFLEALQQQSGEFCSLMWEADQLLKARKALHNPKRNTGEANPFERFSRVRGLQAEMLNAAEAAGIAHVEKRLSTLADGLRQMIVGAPSTT